jgi:hypothetical protein
MAGIDEPLNETGSVESAAEAEAAEVAVEVPAAQTPAEPPPVPDAQFVRYPEGPVAIPAFYVAVTGREAGMLWTDSYRYSRTNMIRAIERTYAAAASEKDKNERLSFPRFVLGSKADKEFVAPGSSLSSSFLLAPINNVAAAVAQTTYTLDTKQRILTELRRDEEGEIIGELTNLWKNDRIEQVSWKAQGDERIVQFGYNRKGDRISEKDYRNGILERTVEMLDGDEIETLYLNEVPLLRAVWREGKKISEERLPNTLTRQYEKR